MEKEKVKIFWAKITDGLLWTKEDGGIFYTSYEVENDTQLVQILKEKGQAVFHEHDKTPMVSHLLSLEEYVMKNLLNSDFILGLEVGVIHGEKGAKSEITRMALVELEGKANGSV